MINVSEIVCNHDATRVLVKSEHKLISLSTEVAQVLLDDRENLRLQLSQLKAGLMEGVLYFVMTDKENNEDVLFLINPKS